MGTSKPSPSVFFVLMLLSIPEGSGADVSSASSTHSKDESALTNILVTAQRREEGLQDVPISLSVFSTSELERRQIETVGDLQYSAPNLTITPWPGERGRVNISMRGHVEPDRFPTLDPPVGLYLDGVYIARIAGANAELIDIERVEVLRGPQGTLFGRNTIGGAINVIPRAPSNELERVVTAGIGNYDRRDLAATFNLPIGEDKHAWRFTASHTEHGGYGSNPLLDRDLNEDETSFVRTQLRLALASSLDLNLSLDATRSNADRDLLTLVAAYPPLTQVPAASGYPDDRLEHYANPAANNVPANRSGPAQLEVWGTSGTLTFASRRFTLKGIAAHRRLESFDGAADLDGTPYDLFTVLTREEEQRQSSLELQAFGTALDGRLDWIGGLHYFVEHGTFTEIFQAVEPIGLLAIENIPRGSVRNDSRAVFGQLTYALSPTLRITTGVRYNEDRRQLSSRNARRRSSAPEACVLDPRVLDDATVCKATLPTETFRYLPWTLGVDFRPIERVLLYSKISRGHRAGGYNFRGATQATFGTFEPERVTAYEVGLRSELLEHRLRLNLAWFRSFFDDIQVRQLSQSPGASVPLPLTSNGGEARIQGGEIEVTGILGAMRLSGAVGMTDAKYTKLSPNVLDITRDSEFLNTPDTTASIALDLPLTLGSAAIDLHVDYSWRDDVPFAYDPDSRARQDAYGLLNATIMTRFDAGNIELKLWGRNVTNRAYFSRAVDSRFLVTAIPGDPRTYGCSVTYRFGSR